MKNSILVRCLLFFFLSGTILSLSSAFPYSPQVMKGAYWPSWRASELPPSAIDTRYFSHIYYSFLVPDNTFTFNIDNDTANSLLGFTTALHSKRPPIKTMYSIGGGGVDPALFARMASTPESRRTFILDTIKVAREYGFDGMDLDWEFPQDATEMGYLSALLDEWRAQIVRESVLSRRPQLLLSGAVYFSSSFFLSNDKRSYPVASINRNMDWINAMCYDFHGSWDTSATGAHAALFDPESNISTSYGLNSWIKAGILRNKLVMGLPLYGKTWTLRDPSVTGVGAPAVAVGPGGDGGVGILLYYQVEQYIAQHNARVVLDFETGSAYAVDGNVWIGYDSKQSTAMKVGYARALRIRGYFFWALGYDLNWEISKTASDLWMH